MAVFTSVSLDELAPWLSAYDVGTAVELSGIASGIENSNFFLTTERQGQQHAYVLTLFEQLSAAELPFYLDLTAHLSAAGIPCPGPERTRDGRTFALLKDKPAAIVRRLPGKSHLRPADAERALVAAMLARMHLAGQQAGQQFSGAQDNPRGPHWWALTAPKVLPFLDADKRALLEDELAFQAAHRQAAPGQRAPGIGADPAAALERGPIHADLFRDNVLFEGGTAAPVLGGFIDFYFAGCDCLLFDVAVCVNDWCIEHDGAATGTLRDAEARVFLDAYHRVRPFTAAERTAWPVLLRAAALRFWLSRLYDFHLPRAGEMITPHDPGHFERILRMRRAAVALPWIEM